MAIGKETIVQIPPDGAAKRFKASQENQKANKQQLIMRGKKLRDKMKVADSIKRMMESDGWKLVEMWYSDKWSFKNIMNEFRQGNEKEYKSMMFQREAIEMLIGHLKWLIAQGDMAAGELEKEEVNARE